MGADILSRGEDTNGRKRAGGFVLVFHLKQRANQQTHAHGSMHIRPSLSDKRSSRHWGRPRMNEGSAM